MTTFNWYYTGDVPIHVKAFLHQQGITRTYLKQIKFHGGVIRANQRAVRVIDWLQPGDQVQLDLPAEPTNDHVVPSPVPLDILYEDDHFLVVNKPAGVASVPSHLYATDSLANRVKGHLIRTHADSQVTHIVTRLDRETSGVVLFAKHHFAHSILDQQLKLGQIDKRYVAVIRGRLDQAHGSFDQPIGRVPGSFIKRQVTPTGRPSLTEYWRLGTSQMASIVAIKLHTGRTHQIRVHFAHDGRPLLGDWLYGQQTDPWIHRQALHAASITFYHPFLQQLITCYAPLPADMARVMTAAVLQHQATFRTKSR